MAARQSHPRLGELLREKELITEDELTRALEVHDETGRPLGEVITDMLGLLTIAEMRDLLLLQRRWRPIGQLFLERGLVTEDQLLEALDEQERTGRPLGEIVGTRYRISSITLEKVLDEQRELELELDRGYTSGLRDALQRRARVRTVKAAPSSIQTLSAFGLAERLTAHVPDAHTQLAGMQMEASAKKADELNAVIMRQQEELTELRSALLDSQMTVLELEEQIGELETLLGEQAAS
jgi:hypothetical protein